MARRPAARSLLTAALLTALTALALHRPSGAALQGLAQALDCRAGLRAQPHAPLGSLLTSPLSQVSLLLAWTLPWAPQHAPPPAAAAVGAAWHKRCCRGRPARPRASWLAPRPGSRPSKAPTVSGMRRMEDEVTLQQGHVQALPLRDLSTRIMPAAIRSRLPGSVIFVPRGIIPGLVTQPGSSNLTPSLEECALACLAHPQCTGATAEDGCFSI